MYVGPSFLNLDLFNCHHALVRMYALLHAII